VTYKHARESNFEYYAKIRQKWKATSFIRKFNRSVKSIINQWSKLTFVNCEAIFKIKSNSLAQNIVDDDFHIAVTTAVVAVYR